MFHKLPISKNLQLCASPNVHVLHCSNRDKVQILQNIEKKNPPKIPNNTFYEVTQTGRFFSNFVPFSELPYAHKYKPSFFYRLYCRAVYIAEWFVLQETFLSRIIRSFKSRSGYDRPRKVYEL